MTGKYKKSRTEQNFDDLILIDVQGIYKIINKNNGKYYVGSSVDIKERWNEHQRNLLSGKHVNPKLQASWNLHSQDAFQFVVVEEIPTATRKILLEAEQKYLDTARTETSNSYNIKFIANGWDWTNGKLIGSLVRGKDHNNYCHDVHEFINQKTFETFVGTRCDFYKKYKLEKKSVRALVLGKFKQTKGWSLKTV